MATEVLTPAAALNALEPEERRLVVFCCALATTRAWTLLELHEPTRAPKLLEAARAVAPLDRRERLAFFARYLSPDLTREAVAKAVSALRREPAWLVALACRSLPAPIRDALLNSPQVREAWEARLTPHPALESYARRLGSRSLEG